MQISDLGLTRRATNCLYRAGITTVEELRQKRTWELQSIPSFGAKCLREVQEALERLEAEKTKTNADRIRAMSDDDLAYWIMCPYDSPFCDGIEHNCIACTKEWLQQAAEEG